MCFVFIWEGIATCATYSIHWLVFITEMKSVYSAVRIGSLNKSVCAFSVKGKWSSNINPIYYTITIQRKITVRENVTRNSTNLPVFCATNLTLNQCYECESIIICTICFIFIKTRTEILQLHNFFNIVPLLYNALCPSLHNLLYDLRIKCFGLRGKPHMHPYIQVLVRGKPTAS